MKYLAIGEMCELLNGFAFKSNEYVSEGIRVIRIANVQKGYIEDSSPCFYPEDQKYAFEKFMLRKNDLLVSLTGNVGRVGLLPEGMMPAALNQRVACLRIKDKYEIDKKYLFHLLNSNHFENACIESSNGAAQKNLSTNWLKKFCVPVPTSDEQKDIARIFDSIIELIYLNKNHLEKLDELVKSRFIEMFGDPEAPDFPYMMVELGDVLRKPASNGFFAKRKDYVEDGNVEILGVANVVNRMYSGIDNLPKTNGTSADIEKYSLSYGDMLFCRSSLVLEGIGKASIVPREVRPNTLFECHVIRMPLDISVCVPEFMQLQSTLPAFRKQVMTKAKTATMTTIDQKSLLSIKVFLPPIEEQKYFLSFIEQVDKLKFETQQSIEKLQMLYDSLAQEYFAPEGD